jgi:hypothetical protein
MGFTLTRDAWKKFKADNNLSKSSVFSKADVGPHIDSLSKAYEQYKKEGGFKNIMSVISKLTDLDKAFAKFIALKETKDELKPDAKKQIETWQSQLKAAVAALSEFARISENALQQKDVENFQARLDHIGLH